MHHRASLPDESGAIEVQVQANDGAIQTATYRKQFIYRDPDVLDFTPKIGPKSGGTMVTIIGQYVNAGRNIKAYFGASSCHIDRTESVVNETHLLCITTMTNATNSAKLSIYFDGAERLAPDYKTFVFTNDPEVSSFYPMTSMISGGRAINVTGQYFTSIQRPKMFVNAGKLFVSEPCMVHSFDKMKCISPPVVLSRVKMDTQVLVGFIMDAVVLQPDLDFEIKDDPVYYPFADDGNIKEYSRGRQLVIEGENLNLASMASEVFVTIGEEECRVVSLSDVQLNCVPPEDAPRGVNKTGISSENGLSEVRVKVGNLDFFIGYLKYPTAEQSKISGAILGLVAALALLLIITILIIVICYLRNRKLDNQIAEEVENWLEIIAMGTRTRPDMVLPFLDFCNYTANMITDGQADNPLFKRRLQSDTDCTKSLEQFYSLLVDESFCLVFIRTLEDQTKMTTNHKATVGYLLTIILQRERHMFYLTELLKVLLAETAVKANKTKRTRSMLKRNDSIMEKILTSWFAITLYTLTKMCIGESVFMMYKAVCVQHNKETGNVMKPTDTVQRSVATVFKECLIVARQQNPVFPAPIKYMFDFMDSLVVKNDIVDRDVAKIWKCDSLHLRFFAKILKRPQSMLDINISRAVGRELDKISQAFVEICSDTKKHQQLTRTLKTLNTFADGCEHTSKK
ncbi:plexin-B-like [Ptychodera flava]|uniref:plexin-B-like n=1 Tax=Ptychodera flava TaxID=63121 RepID=UPI00396A1DFA